ncbi:MAG: CpaF family protein [Lachnospiraceae bacterium]|nr:CpaF family protein [Lachnospiraceae bacterium]
MKNSLFQEYRGRLMERLERSREMSDEEIYDVIDELLTEEDVRIRLRLPQRGELRRELFNSVRRLDILQELVEDDSVTEIMVNGTEGIFLERAGKLLRWDKKFETREKLEDIVQQIVAKCNRVANEAVTIVDAHLENGARVNVVMPPIAICGPVITIRRFPDHPISMEQLIAWNAVSRQAAEFLEKLVRAGYNIFISGGTGSGKTTFLNALSNYIPKDERIITIEDNAELQIQGARNLVRLEARRANEEGDNQVTIRDLIKASLRMRPDRIIVGEVRGDETIDMLQSLNTGHDGSLSTGHGNSPRDMLSRLETMVLMGLEIPVQAIRRQIASGIDLMVHLGRLRDKSRKVLEILEIVGYDISSGEIMTNTLYEFEEQGQDETGRILGTLVKKGELAERHKLERAGISLEEGRMCERPKGG